MTASAVHIYDIVDTHTEPNMVWLPTEHFNFFEVDAPPVSKAKLQLLLPVMLEEQVLQDIDSLHFSPLGKNTNGKLVVAAVERTLMAQWFASLEERDCRPKALLPDCMLLPWKNERTAVLLEDDRILVRVGEFEGFAIDIDQAQGLLALMPDFAPEKTDIYTDIGELPLWLSMGTAKTIDDIGPSDISAGLSVMSGDFRYRPKHQIDRVWALPLVASVVVYLSFLTLLWLQIDSADDRYQQVTNAISADHLAIFGEEFRGSAASLKDTIGSRSDPSDIEESVSLGALKLVLSADQAINACDDCVVKSVDISRRTASILMLTKNEEQARQSFKQVDNLVAQWRPLAEAGAFQVDLRLREAL